MDLEFHSEIFFKVFKIDFIKIFKSVFHISFLLSSFGSLKKYPDFLTRSKIDLERGLEILSTDIQ